VRSCRGKSTGRRSEGAHEGEEEREAREGVRAAPPRRYRRFLAAENTNSGEEFLEISELGIHGIIYYSLQSIILIADERIETLKYV
jgi:hypothetical protein